MDGTCWADLPKRPSTPGWADLPMRPSTSETVSTGSELSHNSVSILAQSMSPCWFSPPATCQATARSADERDRSFADSTLASPCDSPCSPQSHEPSSPPADEQPTGEPDYFASRGAGCSTEGGPEGAAEPLSEVCTRINRIVAPKLRGNFRSEIRIRSTCELCVLCVLAVAAAFQAASAYLHSCWPSSKSDGD